MADLFHCPVCDGTEFTEERKREWDKHLRRIIEHTTGYSCDGCHAFIDEADWRVNGCTPANETKEYVT